MENSAKTLINELNKTETKIITGALEDILNSSEEVFTEICINFNFSSFISNNINSRNIIDKAILIITKATKLKQKNMIELIAKRCGGCFLCCLFIIIAEYECYEKTLYSILTEYLGDVNGALLETKSFMTCCKRTASIYQLDSSEKEVCKRLTEGIWSDYVRGLGVLVTDEYFISKVKEDAKKINKLIELFITEKDGFDISKANEFINKLKEI